MVVSHIALGLKFPFMLEKEAAQLMLLLSWRCRCSVPVFFFPAYRFFSSFVLFSCNGGAIYEYLFLLILQLPTSSAILLCAS
jgi:hypothetical protein